MCSNFQLTFALPTIAAYNTDSVQNYIRKWNSKNRYWSSMQRIVFPALFMSVRIHSFTPQTQAYYCTHWTIHVDLKMKKVYVCQVEGKKKQQSKGKIIWYSVTLKQSVQLETKGNWSECNSLKGRSELETETIIWYFSGTWLCCIVLLNSWRYALNPECCSFSHPCCTSSQTHTHTHIHV